MMIQTIYVFGVAQLLLVYYESNENLPIVSRLANENALVIKSFSSYQNVDPDSNICYYFNLLQLLYKSLLRT